MGYYITRIRVSSREAAKLRLADAYAWHQTLWRAFPDRDGQQRDFLTRVDRKGTEFQVLLLSPRQPAVQPWGQWESKPIPEEFWNYQRYRFSLRANPTQMRVVRLPDGSRRRNGLRTGIYQPEELNRWLARKLKDAGCGLETASFDPPVEERFVRRGRHGKHLRVDFRGVLTVGDRERFREAAGRGIGRARGFGFGMLLLDPIE